MFGKTLQGLEKSAKATAAIGANLFAKFGADDDHIAVCSAASDGIIGVTAEVATAAEQEIRIALDGEIVDLLLGGNVTRGDWLTSDANGAGVTAARAYPHGKYGRYLCAECDNRCGSRGDQRCPCTGFRRIQGISSRPWYAPSPYNRSIEQKGGNKQCLNRKICM